MQQSCTLFSLPISEHFPFVAIHSFFSPVMTVLSNAFLPFHRAIKDPLHAATLSLTFCPLFCQITDRAWTEWILRAQQQFHKTRPLSVKSCKTWPIFSVLSLPTSVGRNDPHTDSGHSGHYGHSGFSLSRHYGPTALALFCTVALWRLLLFSIGCSTLND